MPFGLATAPSNFMRLMTIVFSGMSYNTCLAYLDDIIIFGRTFEEHQERLNRAYTLVQSTYFKLKPSKCQFTSLATSLLTKKLAQIQKYLARYRHGHDRVMKRDTKFSRICYLLQKVYLKLLKHCRAFEQALAERLQIQVERALQAIVQKPQKSVFRCDKYSIYWLYKIVYSRL